MRVYRYDVKDRPSFVLNGGYYSKGHEVIGFGEDESAYEITLTELVKHVLSTPFGTDIDGNTLTEEAALANLTALCASNSLTLTQSDIIKAELGLTDEDFVRVSEDTLVLLLAKGVLSEQDFSASAISKLNERQALRSQL